MRISTLYLYMIRNIVNGKGYIGITKQKPYRRWSAHHTRAFKGEGFLLARALRKYGREAFTFTIIAEAPSWDELVAMEKEAIQQYQTLASTGHGYNLTLGGEGAPGVVVSPERRAQMSIARKASGFRLSEEALKRMAATKRGKPSSPTQKAAASKRFRGVPKTAEHRRRISEGLTGRKLSEETRAKLSQAHQGLVPWNKGRPGPSSWNKGRPISEDTRKKLSLANKGKEPPNKGKPLSEGLRQKLSLAGLQSTKIKRKPVLLDGVIYPSIRAAVQQTGQTMGKVLWALKKGRAIFVQGENEGVL